MCVLNPPQVCLFVNTVTLEVERFEVPSWNFCENKIWSKARTSSKTTAFRCTAARLVTQRLWRSSSALVLVPIKIRKIIQLSFHPQEQRGGSWNSDCWPASEGAISVRCWCTAQRSKRAASCRSESTASTWRCYKWLSGKLVTVLTSVSLMTTYLNGYVMVWPWPFDLETGMRVASKVGNLHSKFGHARPFGSRIIRYYATDGRTDKSNAYCLLAGT